MKKLLTICLLIATTFTVNAQELNFEQTVTYINTFFKDNSKIPYYNGESNTGYLILGIQASKDGKIVFFANYKNQIPTTNFDSPLSSFNLFDVKEFKNTNGNLYFYAAEQSTKKIGYLDLHSESNSERIKKAFLHLQSLCNKSEDPFGN